MDPPLGPNPAHTRLEAGWSLSDWLRECAGDDVLLQHYTPPLVSDTNHNPEVRNYFSGNGVCGEG